MVLQDKTWVCNGPELLVIQQQRPYPPPNRRYSSTDLTNACHCGRWHAWLSSKGGDDPPQCDPPPPGAGMAVEMALEVASWQLAVPDKHLTPAPAAAEPISLEAPPPPPPPRDPTPSLWLTTTWRTCTVLHSLHPHSMNTKILCAAITVHCR